VNAGNTTELSTIFGEAHEQLSSRFRDVQSISLHNQRKVLEAFWAHQVAESDLHGSTGYGLEDFARDKLDRIYAQVFCAEAALVRPQIVSGTHALALGLFGCLRPGEEVVFATGKPYDTLEAVVGLRPSSGSLAEWGVTTHVAALCADGLPDMKKVIGLCSERTKLVMFQKSRGYQQRPAYTIEQLEMWFKEIRSLRSNIIIGVDNCYGEFVERREPSEVGADLVMGSLIKNPGGGIASTGGYIVGKRAYVDAAAARLTAPGVGGEVGPTHDFLRPMYQGLFMAPHAVSQAIQGSLLTAYVLERLGYRVSPKWGETRSDLILSIMFDNAAEVLAFCRAVQQSAPIDAHVTPYGAPMAGYESDVVMAAGSFVQGGSLELSADAPLRPPYTAFFQGGLTYEHVYIAVEKIVATLQGGKKL